jgi:organic hydroperoxide reductase OsmC/OhrA
MNKNHPYTLQIKWTGNRGMGTTKYDAYDRSHQVLVRDKVLIEASSDGIFRGDITKHNPEDFFLASLASCHMLWYLHLCADAGVVVESYEDEPTAILNINKKGIGKFSEATLYPKIKISDISKSSLAIDLHHKANEYCFIANSCNFAVTHQVTIL